MKYPQPTRRRPPTLLLSSSTVIVLAACITTPALAQERTDNKLDEIVVVGVTKRSENLQKVPTTVTSFTGAKLEAQGIRNVSEVATFTPGFNIRGMGNNPTAVAFSMRGQVQNDSLATLEPSVGLYVDDVYVARAYGMNADMLDVSNVQVLKGPQGTLFGRNTSAGAVLISTNDPKFGEVSGLAKITYGRFNEINPVGIINLGLGEKFAVRGALSYASRDGYKTDVYTGAKYEGNRTWNGRLKVAIQPIETLSVLLSGEWFDTKIHGPVRQNLFFKSNSGALGVYNTRAAADRALFAGDPNLVAVSPYGTLSTSWGTPTPASVTMQPGVDARGPYTNMQTETYNARLKLETGFGEIKFINGYRRIKGANQIDLDGTSANAQWTQGFQDLKQYSSELQATGKALDNTLDFALGATYFRETGYDQSRSALTGASTWSNFQGDIANNSYGIYGQVRYHLTEALSFTGGLRYSSDEKGVTQHSGAAANNGSLIVCTPADPAGVNGGTPGYGQLANGCARFRKDTFNNVSYTIGVDYQVTPEVLAYAKHSKGYRSGAEQLRSLSLADTAPANPEIVYEQELGIKSELFDRRVRLNLAGYHNVVQGAQRSQILAINGTNQTILENADMETWGAEASVTVRVAGGFDVFASAALTDPKYKSYTGYVVQGTSPNQVLVPLDKTGYRITGVIHKQWNVGANYSADLPFGTLTLNATYAWNSQMAQDSLPYYQMVSTSTATGGLALSTADANALYQALTTRPIGVTNARASLGFGPENKYEIAIWGRNVFDQRATSYTLFLGGLNLVGTSWNEPATYGITATVRF